ncbi:MAG: SDR family NAD(P)-dependent oxidoreductase [Candidatus Hydrothermales bacterium]
MKDLNNKNFLITGASSGLGKELAFKIASEGGNLLIGSRREEILNKIKNEIVRDFKVKVICSFLDVTDENSVKEFAKIAVKEFESIDCLINNAGMGLYARTQDVEKDDFYKLFDVNVKGIFLMTKEILPLMIKNGKGVIVNVSSLAGYVGSPLMSVYSATKFAIRGFTDSLRRELRTYKINVIGVYPGPFESDFFKNAIKKIEKINIRKNKLMWSDSKEVAQKIIEGIKKGKKNIYVKKLWKIIIKLHDIYPTLFDLPLSSSKYYSTFELD